MSILPRSFGNIPLTIEILNPLLSSNTQTSQSGYNVRVDWKETQEAQVIKADIPRVKREEIKVEVDEGRVLEISGERKEDDNKDDNNVTWHRMERTRDKFVRRFKLPEDFKVDEVKAWFENGVLTVKIPKQELKKSKPKLIQIEGGD